MRVRAILCGLLLMCGLPVGAGEKIVVKTTPEIAFAPAHLMVRTAIEPDPDNRAIEISIDSLNFYRSSTIPLTGDRAPRTSVVVYRDVPSGSYRISARLLGQGGESCAVARGMVDVITKGGR